MDLQDHGSIRPTELHRNEARKTFGGFDFGRLALNLVLFFIHFETFMTLMDIFLEVKHLTPALVNTHMDLQDS